MATFLRAFSAAAFALFYLACLIELLSLAGVAIILDPQRAFDWFAAAFFAFALFAFGLQFDSTYRQAMRNAFGSLDTPISLREHWPALVFAACFLTMIYGAYWVGTNWAGGGPAVQDGQYVMCPRFSSECSPLSLAEYRHDVVIQWRFMSAWFMAVSLTFGCLYRAMAKGSA